MTGDGADAAKDLRGVEAVATLLGVSARTLRFYEEKGLVSPQRIGRIRVYTPKHVETLRVVVRAKTLGLRLADICRFLSAHELHGAEPEPADSRRAHRDAFILSLERQRRAIDLSLSELRSLNASSPT